MVVYRVSKQEYINDLSGEGARLFGGRWNKRGYAMLYCSTSLSLSVLETLVHFDFKFLTSNFSFAEIEIPDNLIKPKLKVKDLDDDWNVNPPSITTQTSGTNWLVSNKSLAMQVPSAVLPYANNVLINPKHKFFSEVKIIKTATLSIDNRVFKR